MPTGRNHINIKTIVMPLLTLKFVTDISDLDYQVVEFTGELDAASVRDAEKKIFDMLPNFKHKFLLLRFYRFKIYK